MGEKVKLKDSIILQGLVARRESIIDRSKLAGTRFDDPEFFYTSDEDDFHVPPFDGIEELNVNMEERDPPPGPKVRIKQVHKRKFVRKD